MLFDEKKLYKYLTEFAGRPADWQTSQRVEDSFVCLVDVLTVAKWRLGFSIQAVVFTDFIICGGGMSLSGLGT